MEHLLRATARAEATHFWFRGFRLFVTPLLRQAIKGRVTPLILDCGCGTGNNLTLLGQFGRAYGFDLTAIGLKIGREAGRSRLTRASVTAVPFPSNTFDIVTSFDVLYSLEQRDEHAAVAEMFRVAKPGGFVVVNVAAMELLRGDHSVLSREVRRYSRASLARLLTGAGFCGRTPDVHQRSPLSRHGPRSRGATPAGPLERRACRPGDHRPDRAREPGADGGPDGRELVARIRRQPFGSSLLCLARKPA